MLGVECDVECGADFEYEVELGPGPGIERDVELGTLGPGPGIE